MGFNFLIQLKSMLEWSLSFLGQASRNVFSVFGYISRGEINRREFLFQGARIAYSSLGVIFMTAVALGVIMAVQVGPDFISRGFGNRFGIVTSITMMRELSPIVGCLMLATQYGAGVAAEIANMKITEQVDALKVLREDPVRYLIVPRFVAASLFTPLVIFMSALISIVSTYVTCYFNFGLSYSSFMSGIWEYFVMDDLIICLLKGSVFGILIVVVATTLGLSTRGGAKEVGTATTLTVILSFIFIVCLDYVITAIYL